MPYLKHIFIFSSLFFSLSLFACVPQNQVSEEQDLKQALPKVKTSSTSSSPSTNLPVRYQTAAYVVDKEVIEDIKIKEESKLKVGARITSTRGPQPLWDIVKRLAGLKKMNVSWASDVDKNVLVDVDINANDDFYNTLDNMLRQVDYFHEMHDNTIVVKYKETRRFQIAMPFTKQKYSTGTGGNILGNNDSAKNVQGIIKLESSDNEFDIWGNITLNLDTMLNIWSSSGQKTTTAAASEEIVDSNLTLDGIGPDSDVCAATDKKNGSRSLLGYYLIDKPVGLITVTAPRPILEKIDTYITTLKKSLYQQIVIEAKMIEVELNDSSNIGLDWEKILKNFPVSGDISFGLKGQVFPRVSGSSQFVSSITLTPSKFQLFINAIENQGNAKILSNPKLSVMNGQPALITVGKNITYIDSIKSTSDTKTGIITHTVKTDRILSGVGMVLTATVLGEDEVIMNLVPITSELDEDINYEKLGSRGDKIGLPVINVREMNTTVKVKDGEMLVVGGLISDSNRTKGGFAPILGKIPFFRYLFGHEEKVHLKRELIILLRPRII